MKSKLLFLIKLLFSVGMLWFIGSKVLGRQGAEGLGQALANMDWRWVALAACMQIAAIACSVQRWRMLLSGQGIHAPLRFLADSFMIGRFWGAFTPGGFTGLGGWRIYDITKRTGKAARAAAVVGIEMVLGQLAFGVVVMFASFWGFRFVGAWGLVLINLGFACVTAFGVITLVRPNWLRRLSHALPNALQPRLQSLVDAICAYQGKTKLLLVAGLAGVGTHAFNNLIYVCTARALGAPLGVGEVFFGSSLQILSTLLPAFINGVGVREATAVALYTRVGVPEAIALLVPVVGFAVEMSVSAIGGILFLLRRREKHVDIVVEDPTREQMHAASIPQVPENEWPRRWEGARLGFAGGLVGGALVGGAEAMVIAWSATEGSVGVQVFLYGMALYGALGAGLGVAMGWAMAWSGRYLARRAVAPSKAYGGYVGGSAALFFAALAAFRIRRDGFDEELVWKSAMGLGVLLAVCVAAALVFVLLGWLAKTLAERAYCDTKRLFLSVGVAYALFLLPAALALGYYNRHHATEDVFPVARGALPTQRPDTQPSNTQKGRAGNAGKDGSPQQAPVGGQVGDALLRSRKILVLVVDTLRADHLPAYGYAQGNTPHLDAFGADSIRFDQAFANASWTRPSFASLLTGRLPSSHGVMSKQAALSDSLQTLPELLRARGFATAGLATNFNVAPYFNFDQGFDVYRYLEPDFPLYADDSSAKLLAMQFFRQRIEKMRASSGRVAPGSAYQDAREVNRHLLSIIDRIDAAPSWFAFAGYMDPHDPYFSHPYDGNGYARAAHPNPDPSDVPMLRTLYDGEIAFFDAQFGVLVDALKQKGLYDDMTIVVTSDHGEEFHDHGGFWHGTTLYDEQLRIPLWLKLPRGERAGEVMHQWVQLIDVMPTLLALAGVDSPKEVQGGSLFAGSAVAFAEESHEGNVLEALRTRGSAGDRKVITANEGNPRGLPPVSYFDVAADPREQHNLADVMPSERDEALAALEEASKTATKGAVRAQAVDLRHDDDAAKRLEALGYAVDE